MKVHNDGFCSVLAIGGLWVELGLFKDIKNAVKLHQLVGGNNDPVYYLLHL